ncbi:hypothetical protein ANCCAN_14903 [Ancylostoma caninum]|uniref:Uncharacterized protein n=1 Tax=Ancylostoma caninum TaxID=29170 RepID=A0A368G672_ANCCA|nr:hypothetical protein ANCCAN_14903 [Ancylostoma caninum]
MRWRTEGEVNFSYSEGGERKNALVKVRLCRQCSEMLNYGSQRRRVEKKKKSRKEKQGATGSADVRNSKEPQEETTKQQEESTSSKEPTKSDAWTGPVQETVRTMDDDIDEFLDDLFD